MPSANVQLETKWWILNDPEDFFAACKEIREDIRWSVQLSVYDGSEDPDVDIWQLGLNPRITGGEPKTAYSGNVVMMVVGNIQIFETEAAWTATYPALAE